MRIPDSGVRGILDEIRDHFSRYLYHQLLRRAFTGLDVSRSSWQQIHNVVDGDLAALSDGSTASPTELYETISAFVEFTRACRLQVCGRIRELLGTSIGWSAEERMLRDITIGSFDTNLARLNGLVRTLFLTVVPVDREQNGEQAVIRDFPELEEQVRGLSGGCRQAEDTVTTEPTASQNDLPD